MVEHSLAVAFPGLRLLLVAAVAALTLVSGVYYVHLGFRMAPHNGSHQP